MTWVYLDDKWDLSDKIRAVSDLAKIVWVRGLTHCRRNATQGFVSEHVTEDFLSRKNFKLLPGCIEELCANHLTEDREPLWTRVKGGFQLNDYGNWNDVEEELERRKKADRDRQAKWRSRHPQQKTEKTAKPSDGNSVSVTEHNVTDNVTVTPLSQPVTLPRARAIPIPSPVPIPVDPTDQQQSAGIKSSRGKPKPVKGEHPLPDGFEPNAATVAFAAKHGRDHRGLVDELRVWSELGNTSKDWQARLRQFVLNAEKRNEHPAGQCDIGEGHRIPPPPPDNDPPDQEYFTPTEQDVQQLLSLAIGESR